MTVEITRRGLLAGGMAGALGFGLAGCGPKKAASLDQVALGISTVKEGYQNFFAAAGQDRSPYKVNYAILPFDLSLQSINDGTLDAGSNFTDIPLTIWGGQMQTARIVAVIRSDAATRYLGLVVRKGLAARGIADLRGKRIGYLRSSNYHYYLLKLLDAQGLTMADIEGVSLNRDMLSAAFASGQLDAWVTQGYETAIAQSRFGGRLIDQAQGDYAGNGVVIANLGSLEDPVRSRAIGDYLLRFRGVIDWIYANPEAWADILAKQTRVDKADYLAWRKQQTQPSRLVAVDDTAIRDQQGAARLFEKAGLIDGKVDLPSLWDRRFGDLLNA